MQNYLKKLENQIFPCPLCDKYLDIRIDKNKKPYLICDDCKSQLFIRGEKGIEKLCERVELIF